MSVSNPRTSFSIISANTTVSNEPQRVLLIGQKTSSGSADSGALVQNIGNNSEENALFGANSILADMVRSFKSINKVSRLDAIALSDNGSGVAATGTLAFSGTPTAEGTLVISIGSSVNYRYELPVTTTDTAATLATALAALINADTKVPVTAGVATATVTITAVNKGTIGNSISILVEGSVPGVSVGLTEMASGATNPSLTGLFSVVDGLRYQTVVYQAEYTLSTLTTSFLDPRWNVNNDILDGVGIITKSDSLANLKTLGNANNTQNLIILGNKLISRTALRGGAIVELNYNVSSQFAAVRSLRLTEDANISRYVIGGDALDQFGGAAISSLPYFNTPFFNLPVIAQGDEFTQEEEDELNTAGVSLLGNNITNLTIIASQIVTTYKTNAGGNPDPTYKYLNYVDTISNVREYFFNNAKSDFRQSRLTEGDLIANRKMHNATSIAAVFTGYYASLSGPDYVLVQAGEDSLQFFKQNLDITLDLSTGSVSAVMVVPIVTQLRTIIATIQLAFSTNS
jgi:phage tail sheath gpL-like